ncbi:hypothetical protein ACQ4PT_039094 [Festuca glaucescens]
MARAPAANPGPRSRRAAGAEARDPWEVAAAALRSRTSSDPWGMGTTQSTAAPLTDAWGTWAPATAPVNVSWGAMASTEAPATVAWGSMASTDAPMTDTWGIRSSEAAPVTHTWWGRASIGAPATDGWGTMASTEALVTYPSGGRASKVARGTWGHDPSDAGDNWGRRETKRSRITVPPPSESEVLMNITVGNAKAFLHCCVCSLPLKPPIFQCDAVRSACRDELLGSGTGRTCIICRGPGYRRCSFMESVVESLRVACPNAAHGCDATPAYYDLHAHRMACAHAPGTRCPVRGCAFVASMAELLDHFTAVHGWPLTTEERAGKSFDIVLRDGFNVVATADRGGSNQQHLLLLNVARQPFGRTVSAVCIHPRPAAHESLASAVTKTVELELRYWAARHYQESEFNVPFVDLIDGLPNDLPHFVVPKSVHSDDDATVLVTAFLTIK